LSSGRRSHGPGFWLFFIFQLIALGAMGRPHEPGRDCGKRPWWRALAASSAGGRLHALINYGASDDLALACSRWFMLAAVMGSLWQPPPASRLPPADARAERPRPAYFSTVIVKR
jgi:hypothetical protein